jgi:hyperosmotically inducible periplasmic protein
VKSKTASIMAVATAAILSILPIQQAFCQDSAAGREMQKSGQAIKSAGSETGESVEHAYHATVDQTSDATLTTKVKSALLRNHRTRKYSIHVESDQGKVTIDGAVGSHSSAKYVQAVVASVKGVRTVDNKLTWPTS